MNEDLLLIKEAKKSERSSICPIFEFSCRSGALRRIRESISGMQY